MNLVDEHPRDDDDDFADDIPDGIGWVRAARAWTLSTRTARLSSLIVAPDWIPGATMEAACLTTYIRAAQSPTSPGGMVTQSRSFTPSPCSRAPGLRCKCGVWGLKKPNTFDETGSWLFNNSVFGIVELSGRIIEGALGYRAQKARVAGIVIHQLKTDVRPKSYEVLKFIADAYKVPLYARWPVETTGEIMQHDPVSDFFKEVP